MFTDLEAAEDSVIKVNTEYADMGVKYVEVEVEYFEKIIGGEDGSSVDTDAKREGMARVVVTEVP